MRSSFRAASETFRSSAVWMLSLDSSQYHPGISTVIDWPLYEISIGRVPRVIGFPVSGQRGDLDILLLLERQEGELCSQTVISELDVESADRMGYVVNVLPNLGIVVRCHGLV